MPEMMTTREVAAYLRIKERKVYELVRERRIPCARVTGKWLFPKALIDLWVLEGSEGPVAGAPRPSPIVAGSHDPLLEWAIRESGSDLALLPGGSLDGLARLAKGEVMACALHVRDEDTGTYNVPLVRSAMADRGVVVIEWARRRQGLLHRGDNAPNIKGLESLSAQGVKTAARQSGAGSQILLLHLLSEAGIDAKDVDWVEPPIRSETDVGLAIREGRADVGMGLEGVAKQFELAFLPLHEERLDLVVTRRDYFEPPIQKLLAFAAGPAFKKRAKEMGGYDLRCFGTVHDNGP